MKIFFLFFLLILLISYQEKEVYANQHRLDPQKVVYGKLSMTIDGKNYSRTILDKDSIRMFVEDLNKSALIGTYDKANPKNVDGLIALVMKDTFVIRLDLKENKINVPYYTECYELHEKYIAFFKKMGSAHLPK